MTTLLDANVLIALVVADHVHHDPAEMWLAGLSGPFATCPITQSSLMRLLVREGMPADTALTMLLALADDPRHEFWPDDVAYPQVPMKGVVGHRQVTDAYLAQLTREHHGRLATFDQGLARLHDDIVDVVSRDDVPQWSGEVSKETDSDGLDLGYRNLGHPRQPAGMHGSDRQAKSGRKRAPHPAGGQVSRPAGGRRGRRTTSSAARAASVVPARPVAPGTHPASAASDAPLPAARANRPG